MATDGPILLFDGVCNLCSRTVQFVYKRDHKALFRFAPLQTPVAEQLLAGHGIDNNNMETMILLEDGNVYLRSTAALRIARHLRRGWPLLYGFIIIPPPIRDAVYRFIGGNRYRWFGKKEVCWIPQGDLKDRFILSEEAAPVPSQE